MQLNPPALKCAASRHSTLHPELHFNWLPMTLQRTSLYPALDKARHDLCGALLHDAAPVLLHSPHSTHSSDAWLAECGSFRWRGL